MSHPHKEIHGYRTITDETFQDDVLTSPEVVLVEFYRNSCSSCGLFEPTLARLYYHYQGRFKFLRYNTDLGHYFTQKYNIVGEPTTAIFYQGELQGTVVGASALSMFESQLRPILVAMANKYNLPPITRFQ